MSKTRPWQDLVHSINSEVAFTPAISLKKDHLSDDEGHPILGGGRVIKPVNKVVHRDPEDPETMVERYRDLDGHYGSHALATSPSSAATLGCSEETVGCSVMLDCFY